MKRKNVILFCIMLVVMLTFLQLTTKSVSATGVMPLTVNMELQPGETGNFDLTILPAARQQLVSINIKGIEQNLDGSLSYFPVAELDDEYAAGWVELPERVVVPPNEQRRVRGTVNVPFGAAGSHTVVAMVHEELPEDRAGVQILVRYAVRIHINIDQPWLRERMNIMDFSLNPDRRGRPELLVHIENPTELAYGAYGEVTVRDENRRLVERVVLRTAAGRQGTRIYPGAEVQFKEVISVPLFPGDYDLRLFMRYADGRQIIQSKQVSLGDEFLTEEALRYLEMSPERISSEIRPGAANTTMLELKNLVGENIYFDLNIADVSPGYERSVFSELEFDLRGSGRNMIYSRSSDRLLAMFRVPREAEAGGYYGSLELEVYSEAGELLETKLIDIEAVVEGELIETVELRDLIAFVDEEETILSLSFRNSGNIAFAPRGIAYIYSEDGEVLKTVPLRLMEDVDRILPQFSGFMTGSVEDLEPGEYRVQVRSELGGNILAEEEFMVEFSEESGGNH